MSSRHHTKLVHEGRYAAEVEVDLIDADTGWSPYLSLPDAQKLDEVPRPCEAEISSEPVNWHVCFSFCRSMSESGPSGLSG